MIAETAIRQPESATATVPIVLEVPAESISDFKLLTSESNFDELALKLREEEIKRFATGLKTRGERQRQHGDVNNGGMGDSPITVQRCIRTLPPTSRLRRAGQSPSSPTAGANSCSASVTTCPPSHGPITGACSAAAPKATNPRPRPSCANSTRKLR